MGVEADLALLAQHAGRIAKALEHLVAEHAPSAAEAARTPLARLLVALAKAERPEQCASLWMRAKDQLPEPERPAAFAVTAATINALGGRTDGDAWLRTQVATAAKAPPAGAGKAPATATAKPATAPRAPGVRR